MPYDAWSQRWLGFSPDASFGLTRNPFDRWVHFGFGLLFLLPLRETFAGWTGVSTRRAGFLALLGIMAASMTYELLEWGVAMTLSPATAATYNGQQGDPWDAQKDMLLALAGGVLAAAAVELGEWNRRRA